MRRRILSTEYFKVLHPTHSAVYMSPQLRRIFYLASDKDALYHVAMTYTSPAPGLDCHLPIPVDSLSLSVQ